MKKNLLITLIFLTIVHFSNAQSIEFELIMPQPELQGSDTGDMEFADIDNDGDADLIITGSGNMSSGTSHSALTTIYLNDGMGTLTPTSDNGIENIRVSKIGFADIDNDSDLDLLISGQTHGGTALTRLYRNDGAGNFTEEESTPFNLLSSGSFNFGDLDGDGDQDVVFSGGVAGSFVGLKFENNGAGSFTAVSDIGIDSVTGVVKLFDYDNDNDLDAIVSGGDPDDNIATKLFSNDGTGVFTLVSNPGFNNLASGDIATGDTDGDGDYDVLIMGNKTGLDIETEFYINNGDGTFTWVEDAPFADVSFSGETSFNDFDQDGDLDVFLIGSGEGGLSTDAIVAHIYENQGNNNFVLSDELIGAYLSTHAVADINNDDLPDLVLGGTTIGSPVRASFIYNNITETSVNVNDPSINNSLNLFPNPSNGIVQMEWSDDLNAIFNVYTTTGKQLFRSRLTNGINNLELNIPNGIYIITVSNSKVRYSEKLVIKN